MRGKDQRSIANEVRAVAVRGRSHYSPVYYFVNNPYSERRGQPGSRDRAITPKRQTSSAGPQTAAYMEQRRGWPGPALYPPCLKLMTGLPRQSSDD